MKYEEIFLEIKYIKQPSDTPNNNPSKDIEGLRKIVTYKLSL